MKIQNYERQLFGTFSRKSTKSCVHYNYNLDNKYSPGGIFLS